MIKSHLLRMVLILVIVLASGACNYPGVPGMTAPATDTATPRATLAPTPTSPPPPTNPPPPPPTEPPAAEVLPTATLAPLPPTQVPPSPVPPTFTPVPITPKSRALFMGTFTGGNLTFRVHDNSKLVIPKTVTVKQIDCKEGGKLSDHISFEPPPMFEIVDTKFKMNQGDQVYIYGQFITPTTARGTITIKIAGDSKTCTAGPIPWSATASGG